MVEQRPVKALVAGSSPAPGANDEDTRKGFFRLRREGSVGRFRAGLEDLASILARGGIRKVY